MSITGLFALKSLFVPPLLYSVLHPSPKKHCWKPVFSCSIEGPGKRLEYGKKRISRFFLPSPFLLQATSLEAVAVTSVRWLDKLSPYCIILWTMTISILSWTKMLLWKMYDPEPYAKGLRGSLTYPCIR